MVIRKGYEENKQNVSPAMFLATNYDKVSEAWTRFSPNLSVSSSFEFNVVA
jgi:U3 small nucleolar RNA-associated protein 22